jgi:ribosomal protein S18 acetylase RimI-like enzyme
VIRLEEMGREEFEASLRAAVARRTQEQVERGVWSASDAGEASRREFAQLFPDGGETPHFRFCRVVDAASGHRVGETWYSVETKGGKVQFWVHWIWIEPPDRRLGYATAVLEQLEREATERGADRMGLFVASDNTEALALYTKLGFNTTNMRMAKRLRPAP